MVPWLGFTFAKSGQVPAVLVPRYGSYVQLYLANLGESPGSALTIFTTNLGAILQTLGAKLVPWFGSTVPSFSTRSVRP